jgi:hypothetical protein
VESAKNIVSVQRGDFVTLESVFIMAFDFDDMFCWEEVVVERIQVEVYHISKSLQNYDDILLNVVTGLSCRVACLLLLKQAQ